jgi:hypothetical protein
MYCSVALDAIRIVISSVYYIIRRNVNLLLLLLFKFQALVVKILTNDKHISLYLIFKPSRQYV